MMVTKGEQTRQAILEHAAQVFSVRGYFGTSIEDLVQATHLTKGGIYNHFGSKEELALEAFDYAVERVRKRFREMLPVERTTHNRLMAVIRLFQSIIDDPIVEGGCPVLNTAIEADDTNLPLLLGARQVVDDWRDFIMRTVNKGKQLGNVRGEVEAEVVASVMMAALEGGIMLSKLYEDEAYMHRVAEYLEGYIEGLLV